MGISKQRFSDLFIFEKRVCISGLQRTESFVLYRLSCTDGTLYLDCSLQYKAHAAIQKMEESK